MLRPPRYPCVVPTIVTARVQEACMHPGHVICEMAETALFPAAMQYLKERSGTA